MTLKLLTIIIGFCCSFVAGLELLYKEARESANGKSDSRPLFCILILCALALAGGTAILDIGYTIKQSDEQVQSDTELHNLKESARSRLVEQEGYLAAQNSRFGKESAVIRGVYESSKQLNALIEGMERDPATKHDFVEQLRAINREMLAAMKTAPGIPSREMVFDLFQDMSKQGINAGLKSMDAFYSPLGDYYLGFNSGFVVQKASSGENRDRFFTSALYPLVGIATNSELSIEWRAQSSFQNMEELHRLHLNELVKRKCLEEDLEMDGGGPVPIIYSPGKRMLINSLSCIASGYEYLRGKKGRKGEFCRFSILSVLFYGGSRVYFIDSYIPAHSIQGEGGIPYNLYFVDRQADILERALLFTEHQFWVKTFFPASLTR